MVDNKYIFHDEEYSVKRNPLTKDAILKIDFPKSFMKESLVADFEIKKNKLAVKKLEYTVLSLEQHAKKLIYFEEPETKKIDKKVEVVNSPVEDGPVLDSNPTPTANPPIGTHLLSTFILNNTNLPRRYWYDAGEDCVTIGVNFGRVYYIRVRRNGPFTNGWEFLSNSHRLSLETTFRDVPPNSSVAPYPWYWFENDYIFLRRRAGNVVSTKLAHTAQSLGFEHNYQEIVATLEQYNAYVNGVRRSITVTLNGEYYNISTNGTSPNRPGLSSGGVLESFDNSEPNRRVYYTILSDKELKSKGFEKYNTYEYYHESQRDKITKVIPHGWEKFQKRYKHYQLGGNVKSTLISTIMHEIRTKITDKVTPNTYISTDSMKYTFGLEIETSTGYVLPHERTALDIHCERDGSLNNGNGGPEFITGVLQGDSGMLMCQKLFRLISRRGEVDKYCSIHLHIGDIKITKRFIVNLFMIGKMIEKEIFSIVAPSRRGNTYCRKLPTLKEIMPEDLTGYRYSTDIMYDKVFKAIFQQASDGLPISAKVNTQTNHPRGAKVGYNHSNIRYCWLNLIPVIFNTRGEITSKTVEIRLHQGTLNFTKFYNWTLLCFAIVKYAESHFVLEENINNLTLKEIILATTKTKTEQLLIYLEERKKAFEDKQTEEKEQTERTVQQFNKINDLICA